MKRAVESLVRLKRRASEWTWAQGDDDMRGDEAVASESTVKVLLAFAEGG
jgi:hypothetical protein